MKALLIVDVQNDFMPGGALAVPHGNEIIEPLNALLKEPFDFVLATKDWHPKEHGSFAANQNKQVGEHIKLGGVDQRLWPVHCVKNTFGAEFAPGWKTSKVDKIFYKGTNPKIDSYSAFFDNAHSHSTGLADFLKEHRVDTIYIAGLATDYCVKYSVLDAIKLGFKVVVLADVCRGIEGEEEALEEMRQAGALINLAHGKA